MKNLRARLYWLEELIVSAGTIMVRQLKPIGAYSERQARKYLKLGLLFLIPFAVLYLTSIPYLPFYVDLGRFEINRGFLMGVFSSFGLVFIMLPYRTYRSGLNGERKVIKNISDKLGSNYSLLNDVLLNDGKRGNVDHMIVGPTGIFVIETKNNQWIVTFDGYRWKGIRGEPCGQAKYNTFRIKDILKSCEVFKEKDLYVNAVVLFTNRRINLKISKDPEWCKVLQIKRARTKQFVQFFRRNILPVYKFLVIKNLRCSAFCFIFILCPSLRSLSQKTILA